MCANGSQSEPDKPIFCEQQKTGDNYRKQIHKQNMEKEKKMIFSHAPCKNYFHLFKKHQELLSYPIILNLPLEISKFQRLLESLES